MVEAPPAISPAELLAAIDKPATEKRRYWVVVCACGRRSTMIFGTRDEAKAHAVKTAGFRPMNGTHWCRKCISKVVPDASEVAARI